MDLTKASEITEYGVSIGASDIHICAGDSIRFRVNGVLESRGSVLSPEMTRSIARSFASFACDSDFESLQSLDFASSTESGVRLRCNLYKEKGNYACAVRILPHTIPSCKELGIPQSIINATQKTRGLILVTGSTGHGKTTTLAALTDMINTYYSMHIITLEDPVEYIHTHKKSVVSQREIGTDAPSFSSGLRDALREDPDVILVGEMRDCETIASALTAAETGHLVLATLHTSGCAASISRIVDVFPPEQQSMIRVMLAEVLECIVNQKLITMKDGTRRAAFEVLTATPAIRNLIRENKPHQIYSQIQLGHSLGMQTMDESLLSIYSGGGADESVIMKNCTDPTWMINHLN